mgnify:CR=1 FL=1
MVCKECGKEIPEGALYCESCGAPLEEPIVLKVSKEDIKRAEKEEKAKAKERAKHAAKNTVKQVPEKKHHRKAADTSKAIDRWIFPVHRWRYEPVAGVCRFDFVISGAVYELDLGEAF